nr:MAG TPA: Thiol:disulfide interchange protein dsbC [Caudoviricetes sp.]
MSRQRAWCRYCGEEIRWAQSVNGKNIPLNIVPNPLGRWIFDMGKVRQLWGIDWERAQEDGERLYVGHMQTCPHQQDRRKK